MTRLLTSVCIILLLAGCGNRLSPLEVSERFWTAVQQGDMRAVERHSAAGTVGRRIDSEDMLNVIGVEFGRVIIDGERAVVETTATIGNDRTYELPLKTYLQQEQETWKVDHDASLAVLYSDGSAAILFDTIQRINETLSRQLRESLTELQGLVPLLERELAELERSLKESLPELRRQVEEALREFERSLPAPDSDPAERGAVEI